ncbi:4Fe-4S binding protein [Labilibacter sediminis]|nr:4Fe-4S binding protein [Labilibacter sediminis]
MKLNKKLFNQVHTYLLVLIILLAVAIQSGTSLFTTDKFQEPHLTLDQVKELYPKAKGFSEKKDGELLVYGNKHKELGYVYPSYKYKLTSGYGGYVPVLWAVDTTMVINGSLMLSNNETPEFLDHLKAVEFMNGFSDLALSEVLNDKVDAVSGATETSEAVLKDLKAVAVSVLDASIADKKMDWSKAVNTMLFVLLLFYAVISIYIKGLKKYRKYYLIVVVLLMGVMARKMLSLEFVQGVLKNGLPWQSNWEVAVLLLLAIIIPWLKQRSFYCLYICPMGAMQELVGQISPIKKRTLQTIRWKNISLSQLYLTVIWVALLSGFNMELSTLEPFMIFSFKIAGYGIIILTAVVLLLSIFINKPWCSVCPTGCLLRTLEPVKK